MDFTGIDHACPVQYFIKENEGVPALFVIITSIGYSQPKKQNCMKTRKELKEEYKQMKFKMGVFQIRNIVNGKVFIGSSTDLEAIWHAQRLQLNMGIHQNGELQREWNEYGAENFIYETREEIKQTDDKPVDYAKEVKALEELVIEELQPYGLKGYHKAQK